MKAVAKRKLAQHLQDWIEARKRFHLSHASLGMNPKKLGKLDNHHQEPWKAPLPEFIEHLYFKRFSRKRPEVVMSVEERARATESQRAARKEAKRLARAEANATPARVSSTAHQNGSPEPERALPNTPERGRTSGRTRVSHSKPACLITR